MFHRVKCFILDFPTRTAATDEMFGVLLGDRQVGDPSEMLEPLPFRSVFGVLQKVDTDMHLLV